MNILLNKGVNRTPSYLKAMLPRRCFGAGTTPEQWLGNKAIYNEIKADNTTAFVVVRIVDGDTDSINVKSVGLRGAT